MADENNFTDRLVWFVAGVAVGAAVGLLFAPKTGSEMRRLIGKKTAEGRDYVAETGRDIYSKGRDLYERGKDLADDAGELFERGRKLVRL